MIAKINDSIFIDIDDVLSINIQDVGAQTGVRVTFRSSEQKVSFYEDSYPGVCEDFRTFLEKRLLVPITEEQFEKMLHNLQSSKTITITSESMADA